MEPAPRHFVRDLRWLEAGSFVLRVDRAGLRFTAGQCVSLGLWRSGVTREYSIYSGEQDDHLEFLVRVVRNGTVSPALAALRPGDPVYLAGPYSDFGLSSESLEAPHLLVATGTGIAPFHSFVRTHPRLDYLLLHGVRDPEQRYDFTAYETARYVACVSGESGPHFHGRVTAKLRQLDPRPRTRAYLCGNHAMIEECFDILRAKGVAADDVHAEVFF